jgi:hypothetical protein
MHEQGAVGASIPGTVPVGIPSTSSEGVVFPRNNRSAGLVKAPAHSWRRRTTKRFKGVRREGCRARTL